MKKMIKKFILKPSIESFILVIIISFIVFVIFVILLNEDFKNNKWEIDETNFESYENFKKNSKVNLVLEPIIIKPKEPPHLMPITRKRNVKNVRDPKLGQLQGGRSNCVIYPTDMYVDDSFSNCLQLDVQPHKPYVCTHDLNSDIHISFTLQRDSIWEKEMVELFRDILMGDPELGVYDIGANVGVYTMVAASLGHKVVAVEPHKPNLVELGRGLKKNHFEKQVIVLRNAVSNKHGTYELYIPPDNQGGARLTSQDADKFCSEFNCPTHVENIVMNDLLDVTNFKKAIIKIDIEGHEHKAMRISKKFFKMVEVTHILMEWQHLREYFGTLKDENEDKTLVNEMMEMFRLRGFHAEDIHKRDVLSLEHWYGWPDNVLWVNSNYSSTADKQLVNT